MLGLKEDATEIFADDADREQLQTPKKQNGDNKGGITLNRVAEYDGLNKDIQHIEHSKHGDNQSHDRGYA